jgi:DNA-binding response OmpR family regulator
MNHKILILDDDVDIVELLEYILQKRGYETVGATDSRKAMNAIKENKFSILIVDRNLPCTEGTEFVGELRKRKVDTPVIFLTAKGSKQEKREGFTVGGDDYITKPFDAEELSLRIEAILRRTAGEVSRTNTLSYRDIEMNLDLFEVTIDDKVVELTKLEFNLLKTFIQNRTVVLDRDYLLDVVWQCSVFDEHCSEKSVNVAIKRLKEKIDPDKSKGYIKSVRGVGYKLA